MNIIFKKNNNFSCFNWPIWQWMPQILDAFNLFFVSPYRAPVSYSIQLKAISLVFYFNHPHDLVNTIYKYIYTFDFIIPHFRLGRIQFLWILSLSTFYYILHSFTRSLGKLTMLWNLPSTPHLIGISICNNRFTFCMQQCHSHISILHFALFCTTFAYRFA